MRHAGPARIESLSPMLEKIRAIEPLREKKPGIFYYRSRAFLHFHEDGDDTYADVRLGGEDFERFKCSSRREQDALVQRIREWLS